MRHSVKIICMAAALALACSALVGCGDKKDDSKTASSVSSVDTAQDVDNQIDDCQTALDSAEDLPAVAKKSALEILRETLEDMAKRTDLTDEQTKQINELLDKVNEQLKDTADIDLDDPDLKLSDIVG